MAYKFVCSTMRLARFDQNSTQYTGETPRTTRTTAHFRKAAVSARNVLKPSAAPAHSTRPGTSTIGARDALML